MKSIIKIYGLLAISLIFSVSVKAQKDENLISYGNNKEVGSYITVDGAKQYYEVYGQGKPLVLIHGNGGNIAYMKPQIEFFAKRYKVIVMDCRGRGKSELQIITLTYLIQL